MNEVLTTLADKQLKSLMKIDKGTGFISFDNFTLDHDTKKLDLELKIAYNRGEFKFSHKNADEETFIIKIDDGYVYTVCFKENKVILVTVEYLDFAQDFSSYAEKKDRRINKTKEILAELGLDESNIYSWGEVSYFYEPRNETPLILIKYN